MVIENNPFMRGARGKLSGVVFYAAGGKTIVASRPRRKKVPFEKQTEAQRNTRLNFMDAACYAKAVTANPERKAYYARKAKAIGVRSAYSAAIADYMRGLSIESVDTRRYNGKAGGQVKITARKKDFSAKAVNVTLKTGTGTIIEQGKAVMDSNGAWIYRNRVEILNSAVVFEITAENCNGKRIMAHAAT